ncbi:MAG: DUF2844 domain-containing protein [Burkholderiaceae bacterium]
MSFKYAICAAMLCMHAPSFAALGELPMASLGAPAPQGLALTVVPGHDHTVHELQTESGTRVREYIGADGKVFAVSWRGPFLPDLQVLLGSHFAAYAAMAQRNPVASRTMDMQTPTLVVHSGGRMRAFAGYAYLPRQLPTGVNLSALR